jgi:hypothetical protein
MIVYLLLRKGRVLELKKHALFVFHRVIKCVISLLFLFIISCKSYEALKNYKREIKYDLKRDLLVLDISSSCKDISLLLDGSYIKRIKQEDLIAIPRKDLQGIKEIKLTCDDKIIDVLTLPEKPYKILFGLYFDEANQLIAEEEKELFYNTSFFEDFKNHALKNKKTMINSLKFIKYFTVDKEFDIAYEGFKKFENKEIFDYIKENSKRFFSLPRFEDFIKFVLSYSHENYKEEIYSHLLERPTKRSYSLIRPYLGKDQMLDRRFFEFINMNLESEFTYEFINNVIDNLDKNRLDDITHKGVVFILSKDFDISNEILKRVIFQVSFKKEVISYLGNRNIDYNMAQFIRKNISKIDKEIIKVSYPLLLNHFFNDKDFYIEVLAIAPELEDSILNVLLSLNEYVDRRVVDFYIKQARKRPIPNFVFKYIYNGNEGVKKEFFQEIFKEPILQKEVLDLMEDSNEILFENKIIEIVNNPENNLWEYSLTKLGKLGYNKVDLISIYKKTKNIKKKGLLLIEMSKVDEEHQKFVLQELNKGFTDDNFAIVKSLMANGTEEIALKIWTDIDKKNKNLFQKVLNGIEKRNYFLCDEILKIVLENADMDIKSSALWSYIYSCKEMFLDNFEKVKVTGDKEFFNEMIFGLRDLVTIKPSIKDKAIMKLKNIYEKEEDEKLRFEIRAILEKINKEQ